MQAEDANSPAESAEAASTAHRRDSTANRVKIILATVAVAVISASVVRADRRTVTHDEALTYLTFVLGGLETFLFHYIPNNHPVNTELCRLSTALFGVSPFGLRLGAVLAGAGAVILLATMIARSRPNAILAFVASSSLFLWPTFFDFASLARGYVIGVFFLIAATERIIATTDPGRRPRRYDRALIAGFQALAVLSVPTFLAGAVALEIAYFLYRRKFGAVPFSKLISESARAASIFLLVPAVVLLLPLLSLEAPPDSIAGKSTFDAFRQSLERHLYFPSSPTSPTAGMTLTWRRMFPPTFFLGTVGAAATCALVGFFAAQKGSKRTYAERWAIVAAIASSLTAVFHAASVGIFGFHWPMPRVLIDLFVTGWSTVIAVAIAAKGFRRAGRWVSSCFAVVMGIAVTVFVSGIEFGVTLDWPSDASAELIQREISTMFRDRGDRPAEVWCEPTIERSVEFYRVSEKSIWIAPIETSWGEQPKKAYDAYILHDGFLAIPEVLQHLRIVKRIADTGRFIAVVK